MGRPPERPTWTHFLGSVASLAFLGGCGPAPSSPGTPAGPSASQELAAPPAPWRIDPTSSVTPSPALLELGKQTYSRHCSGCHGATGRGDGPAAFLLYPRPRDMVSARYRLVSTWEGQTTDEDLYRTISRGMPGSAMPSWAHLPETTRWALVHHVKSLAEMPIEIARSTPDNPRAGVVQVPREPPFGAAEREQAAELFLKGCAACHGDTGRGDGVQKQIDTEGYPTRPRDLTLGVFKGVPSPEDVYRRIVLGMPGTPMPASAYLHGDGAWHLTHQVLSLSSEKQRERVEMKRFRVVARRTRSLPTHPDDSAWRAAPSTNLHLMPLWWRAARPEELTVQALHDEKEIAILLSWADSTHDHTAMRPQDFRDAAAIQLSLGPDEPPFFAMGDAQTPVNIWMWKAERQADIASSFQELEEIYPNIGIDAYPNLARSPLEQPLRSALTLQSDPTYVTAWGAGNIVADPARKSPVEDLSARGFGTLRARPRIDQKIQSEGVYSTGTYHVMFRRSLAATGVDSVALEPASRVPVAFAVWNGSEGDRDGKKSITVWQDLILE